MDVYILTISSVLLGLYMVIQLVLFRIFPAPFMVPRLLVSGAVLSVCAVGAMLFSGGSADAITLTAGIVTAGWIVYILTVFSYSEASLTLRALWEISESGTEGITKSKLAARYGIREIVAKRLSRLVRSGELIRTGQHTYRKTGVLAGFSVRNRIVKLHAALFSRV